jgi:[ribosomal protein S18]-alanine N-acetyltransferase
MAAGDIDGMRAIAGMHPQAPHWPRSAYLNAIIPESTPCRIALVAGASVAGCQPGSIHGFAVASLLPPQAELETIVVAPQSQRRGLGQHLFQALAAELMAAGVTELLLEVRVSNHSALAFYRALGFVEIGHRPAYYTDPIEDAVLMRLPLIERSSSAPVGQA